MKKIWGDKAARTVLRDAQRIIAHEADWIKRSIAIDFLGRACKPEAARAVAWSLVGAITRAAVASPAPTTLMVDRAIELVVAELEDTEIMIDGGIVIVDRGMMEDWHDSSFCSHRHVLDLLDVVG